MHFFLLSSPALLYLKSNPEMLIYETLAHLLLKIKHVEVYLQIKLKHIKACFQKKKKKLTHINKAQFTLIKKSVSVC